MPTFNPVTPDIIKKLTAVLPPDHLSTAHIERELRSKDMSGHEPHLSEVVVWPTTSQQIEQIMQLANEAHIPVTPWGVGSSIEGNPIPLHGGILLSTERMAQIIDVHADDFQVTVQPGIGHVDLNKQLAQHGLFFPPDPGANATIGGMLANNAAGIRTVKYGASKDNVVAMDVVLADGRLLHLGSRSIKQSSGYDLLHLFVGSEGTLGIITQATLKLAPIPNLMSAVVASFADVETAVEAVVTIRGSGLDPAALEFIDADTAQLLSTESQAQFGQNPTLFMEFHNTHAQALELIINHTKEICHELGATHFRASADPAERHKLWEARHHMFETVVRVHRGKRWMVTDVAVPISAYPALVRHAKATLTMHNTIGFMVGHAGDGNLHMTLPFTDSNSYQTMSQINEAVVQKAIDLGGTATGEHGVGIGKRKYMAQEHGSALDVMWQLKQTLDPKGILNPSKIFPT